MLDAELPRTAAPGRMQGELVSHRFTAVLATAAVATSVGIAAAFVPAADAAPSAPGPSATAVSSAPVDPTATQTAGPPPPPDPPPHADSCRFVPKDAAETALFLSRRHFPKGAREVYLVKATDVDDAISAGSLAGGPVLLVPGKGRVPAPVLAEIRRLRPKRVIAIGGTYPVPNATLKAAAQGRPTMRLAGYSAYDTAAAVSRYAHPTRNGVPRAAIDLFLVPRPAPAVGLLTGILASPSTPVLPLPPKGPAPKVVRSEIQRLNAWDVVLAAPGAVSPATVRSAVGPKALVDDTMMTPGRATDVLTASAIVNSASDTVYVVGSTADLMAAGPLGKPFIVVPPGTKPSQDLRDSLRLARPKHVVAIGSTKTVPDSVVKTLVAAAVAPS